MNKIINKMMTVTAAALTVAGLAWAQDDAGKTDVSANITFIDGGAAYTGSELEYESASISGITEGANPVWEYTYAVASAADNGNAALGADGKPLTAGAYTVTATYSDDDNIGTKEAAFAVSKADPDYAALIPIGLTAVYRQALLLVSLDDYDGWSWMTMDKRKTVGDAGDQIHKARFTPDDTDNYNIVENIDVSVSVGKADPAVSPWPTSAADITYGAPLSSSELTGGMAGILTPGTFAWSDGSAVPPVNNSGYEVTFIPTDTANYNTATSPSPVSITVNPAELTLTADDKNIFIGANEPTSYTYKITGFVNGDTEEAVDIAGLAFGLDRAFSSDAAGSFDIIPSGAAAANYTFSYVNGTLTVGYATSVSVSDRTLPAADLFEDAAVVAPVKAAADGFTAGPNVIRRGDGAVKIYRVGGTLVRSGTLTVYDATGNVVNKITVLDNSPLSTLSLASPGNRREVGRWDLRDAKGRAVAEGAYLLRGVVRTADGKREKVSLKVSVR